MTRHSLLAATALAGSLAALPAAALTAPELWADWQATAEGFGLSLEAEGERYADGVLTLDGMTAAYSVEMEGEPVAFDFTYETVVLTERGADTVVVTMPERTTFTGSTTQAGTTREDTGTLEQIGMETVVTDEGPVRRYVTTGERYTQVTNTAADPDAGTPALVQTVTMTGVASETSLGSAEDPAAFVSASTAEGLVIDVRAADDSFSFAYQGGGLELDGSGRLPDTSGDDPLAVMNALDLSAGYGLGPATFKAVSEVEGAGFTASGSLGASRTDMAFGEAGLAYSGTLDGMELEVRPAPFPIPFAGSLDEMSFGLTMPTRATPAAQDYGLDLTIAGLELSDAIWGFADPTGQLPRDPATIRLEAGGTTRVTADVFSEEVANAPVPPFEPQSLDLTALEVTAAGASLTGTGALTFPVLFPQPQPLGQVSLRLEGGLQLLDRLVSMGVVPADQATFARGMIGVVARPAGEGVFESTIEFTEGGGIVANGLPLQ